MIEAARQYTDLLLKSLDQPTTEALPELLQLGRLINLAPRIVQADLQAVRDYAKRPHDDDAALAAQAETEQAERVRVARANLETATASLEGAERDFVSAQAAHVETVAAIAAAEAATARPTCAPAIQQLKENENATH